MSAAAKFAGWHHPLARNTDAERKASEIRLRAERRAGELLKELARATPAEVAKAGGHAKAATPNVAEKQTSPYAQALADTGISTQAVSRLASKPWGPQRPVTGPAWSDTEPMMHWCERSAS